MEPQVLGEQTRVEVLHGGPEAREHHRPAGGGAEDRAGEEEDGDSRTNCSNINTDGAMFDGDANKLEDEKTNNNDTIEVNDDDVVSI